MHNADLQGIGYDRSSTGSNAVSEYAPPVGDKYNDLCHVPRRVPLLWFHHVPWDYKMHSDRTVWDELCYRYNTGVDYVKGMQSQWETMKGKVDPERFAAAQAKLAKQVKRRITHLARYLHSFFPIQERQTSPVPILAVQPLLPMPQLPLPILNLPRWLRPRFFRLRAAVIAGLCL